MNMKAVKALLLMFLSLPFFQMSAKTAVPVETSGSGIRNGFSITGSYLPVRFPSYDYDTKEWGSTTVNGYGAGIDYNLSVPILSSRWELKTGLGCTYSRIDESGNKEMLEFGFYAPGESVSTISGGYPQPFSYKAYYETKREYIYLYLPVEIGYQLYTKGNFSIIPFLGFQGKYNIGFTENGYVESATWRDHYFELFDKSSVDSDAERFIIQMKAGVEFKYDKLFLSLSFTRDMDRMYRDALIKSSYRGYWGPYTFNCWQLGFGMNF
jgi:hypothetical protein